MNASKPANGVFLSFGSGACTLSPQIRLLDPFVMKKLVSGALQDKASRLQPSRIVVF